eukprot:scaffold12417_cov131-Isochrysis_galbana.AAC.11
MAWVAAGQQAVERVAAALVAAEPAAAAPAAVVRYLPAPGGQPSAAALLVRGNAVAPEMVLHAAAAAALVVGAPAPAPAEAAAPAAAALAAADHQRTADSLAPGAGASAFRAPGAAVAPSAAVRPAAPATGAPRAASQADPVQVEAQPEASERAVAELGLRSSPC